MSGGRVDQRRASMRRVRRSGRVAGAAVALSLLAACTTAQDRQAVRAGNRTPSGAASTTPMTAPTTLPVSTVVAPPVVFDEARARYEVVRAPAGSVVARGPAVAVDQIRLRAAVRAHTRSGLRTVSEALRIKITGGPFPYGDARVLVLVDGRSLGEGQVADGGRTLSAAVFDPALIHDGAVVAYRIEPRSPVTVATLRAGG